MLWSPEQDRALKSVRRWLRERDRQVFRLFGYAGTGKTTLALEAGRSHPLVTFTAYTGKAAHVMRQIGCEPVSTIHKLIYIPVEDEKTGAVTVQLRSPEDLDDVALIVVDECSMVDGVLARHLLSFGKLMLVVGDPFQLPPISDDGGYFMREKPDAMLTTIHRQAADSPILRLAERIRKGKPLPLPGHRVDDILQVVDGGEDVADYDVILCGLNDTRHRRNRQLRRRYGFARSSDYRKAPQPGETVVCLQNDYSVEAPVFNGGLWQIMHAEPANHKVPSLRLLLRSQYDNERTTVQVPIECFNEHKLERYRGLQLFDFGYALTVHKSQGSQWDSVLLVNESQCFRAHPARWLYTGITRASNKLTIVN